MLLRKYKITLIFLISFLAFITVEFAFSEQLIDNWYHYEQGLKMVHYKIWDQAQKEFTYYLNHPEMHRHMFGVAYFGRGQMFQAMGRYDQAIIEYRLAIENDLHPTVAISDKAYMNIGTIYFKNKAYQDAITAYSKAAGINPQNGLAHYYLGLAYLRAGEYKKAVEEADKAKKLGIPFTALTDELNKKINTSSKKQDNKKDNQTGQTPKTNN